MYSNLPRLEAAPQLPAPFWYLNHRSSTCVVTDDGRRFSYSSLQQEVDAIKEALTAPVKSLVFVMCSQSVPSLAAYLACLQIGHAAVLLPHDMEPALLAPLLAAYHPDFIWSLREIGEGAYGDSGFGSEGYRMYRREGEASEVSISPDLALMLTTSGSTGNPKMVRLSYANLQANARSIAEYLEIGPRDRPVTSLPMHYSYGLSVINSHLLRGATLIQTAKKIRSPEFWQFAWTYGATSLAGVPYVYQILHEIGFESMDLPSLRSMTQAGGYLDLALQDHFIRLAKRKGIRYYTMYGQTEATARISYVPSHRAEEGAGSIGVPIPGGKFEIIDGELVYSGPNVMLGYAESRGDLSKGDELGGRLFTGDMARLGDNGFCYVVGRKKRFIKPMGLRINLDDVERQLAAHLQKRVVVVGTDSSLRVISTDCSVEDAAIEFIRNTYHISRRLCSFSVIDEIPVMPTGKVDYGALHSFAFAPPAAAPDEVIHLRDVEIVSFPGEDPMAQAV
ncbi:AMP-binding protein [Luteolibacter luteus]|uniref:AMP-binding protein n=1 Tax=Luteolibacter luteus TaxID=2728835 RepID=A0A858RGM8_9BACT|nr:AMP-binding protein [Luteolibacter luteus]QJE95855.1 AMP-binding protein [Luteolibacter luteus]